MIRKKRHIFLLIALLAVGLLAVTTTALAAPNAPGSLSLTANDNSSITATWTASTTPNVNYEVSIDSGANWTSVGATLTYTFRNLVNGTQYTISVRAFDAAGDRSNIESASIAAEGVPGAPTINNVIPGNTTLTVDWTPSSDDGNAGAVTFTVGVLPAGGSTTYINVGATTSYTIPNLANGVSHTIYVYAENTHGRSSLARGNGTPATMPDAPTNVRAQYRSQDPDDSMYLSWSAPASGGHAIEYYEIFVDGSSVGDTRTGPGAATRTNFIIPGRTSNQTYVIEVLAHNDMGDGPRSAPINATHVGFPAAPINLTASPLDGEVELNWTAADNGGSPILGYGVRLNSASGVTSISGTNTNYLYRGLTNNTSYTFEVAARNARGYGPWSNIATATPIDIPVPPSAPRNLQADPGNGWIQFTWTDPANHGKADIWYEYSLDGSIWVAIGAEPSYLLTGLTNNTTYTFYVRARNIAGAGPDVSTRATPSRYAGTPPAPSIYIEYYGGDMAVLRWNPTNTAIAVDYYEVSLDGLVWDIVSKDERIYYIYAMTDKLSYEFYVRGVNSRGEGVSAHLTLYGSEHPGQLVQPFSDPHTTPRQPGIITYDVVSYSQPAGSSQVGTIYAGESVGIIGSNASGSWLRVTFAEDGKAGWVPADAVALQ